jgi:hypothetical protein
LPLKRQNCFIVVFKKAELRQLSPIHKKKILPKDLGFVQTENQTGSGILWMAGVKPSADQIDQLLLPFEFFLIERDLGAGDYSRILAATADSIE